jgi:uncharacterized membrane protein YqhA
MEEKDFTEQTPSPEADAAALAEELEACREGRRSVKVARDTTAATRFIAAVPALGFFVASIVLAVGTLLAVFHVSLEFLAGGIDVKTLAIEFVEYADVFLLSVVLYILALGLVSLFITDQLALPSWLTFRNFDDLKERLVSVIGAMLGVYFLGYVLKGATGIDVLWIGLAVAIVILALTLFVRNVLMRGDRRP